MGQRWIVAIFDSALQAFGQPVFVQAVAAGVRSFTDEVNQAREGNQLHDHPEDFDLWQLGTFDDESGVFENHRQLVVRGKDCVRISN